MAATGIRGRTTFAGSCLACEGTGLWQGRAGYPCRACKSTGKVPVAFVRVGAGWMLHLVGANGKPLKSMYEVSAELTAECKRFHCGSTVGHGWYEQPLGADPVGAACTVYGVGDNGELFVRLPGGGVTSTGHHKTPNGNEYTVAVRILDPEAEAAIAEVVQS